VGATARRADSAAVMQATHLDLDEVVDVREEGGAYRHRTGSQKPYERRDLLKGSPRKISIRLLISALRSQRGLVTARRYVPEAGEIVMAELTRRQARVKAVHRPALVLSPAAYNDKTSLMICCPMTTQIKKLSLRGSYRRHAGDCGLADQVKSLDWRSRRQGRRALYLPKNWADVRAKILTLIGC